MFSGKDCNICRAISAHPSLTAAFKLSRYVAVGLPAFKHREKKADTESGGLCTVHLRRGRKGKYCEGRWEKLQDFGKMRSTQHTTQVCESILAYTQSNVKRYIYIKAIHIVVFGLSEPKQMVMECLTFIAKGGSLGGSVI